MAQHIRQTILFIGFIGNVLAADPFVGIWKLDVTKSAGTAPKGETLVVKQQGDRLFVEVSVFDANLNTPTTSIRYSVPAIGGNGRVEAGPYDGVSIHRDNPTTLEMTYLSHGEKVITARGTLSKDGHSMIVRARSFARPNYHRGRW